MRYASSTLAILAILGFFAGAGCGSDSESDLGCAISASSCDAWKECGDLL